VARRSRDGVGCIDPPLPRIPPVANLIEPLRGSLDSCVRMNDSQELPLTPSFQEGE
jgi:hypothetical protein